MESVQCLRASALSRGDFPSRHPESRHQMAFGYDGDGTRPDGADLFAEAAAGAGAASDEGAPPDHHQGGVRIRAGLETEIADLPLEGDAGRRVDPRDPDSDSLGAFGLDQRSLGTGRGTGDVGAHQAWLPGCLDRRQDTSVVLDFEDGARWTGPDALVASCTFFEKILVGQEGAGGSEQGSRRLVGRRPGCCRSVSEGVDP